MMDSVMLGSVQDPLQRSEITDDLGVNPKLVQQVKLSMDNHVSRRNEKGHRQVERLQIANKNVVLDKIKKNLVPRIQMLALSTVSGLWSSCTLPNCDGPDAKPTGC